MSGRLVHLPAMSSEPLELFTLGAFLVKRGDRLLSDEADRANKMWDLLKFIVTFRGKLLTPEFIVESLWPDQDYREPRLALRALVHRLRKAIDQPRPGAHEGGKSSHLLFTHGCYTWNARLEYRLDAERFEQLCRLAKQKLVESPEEAADLYREALQLYRGEYLPECSHAWVEPFRNHFRRLFVQAVLSLGNLLLPQRATGELIEICERATELEPLEEDLHALYLQVLLAEGKISQATLHYRRATAAMYRELGLKPSAAMRRLRRSMESGPEEAGSGMASIERDLRSSGQDRGPFLCDPTVFQTLYELEQRRAERYGVSAWLLVMSLLPGAAYEGKAMIERAAVDLREVLTGHLRKSDVFCRWSETQFLVLLQRSDAAGARNVADRIAVAFCGCQSAGRVSLEVELGPVTARPGPAS